MAQKRSFFERLTGVVHIDDEEQEQTPEQQKRLSVKDQGGNNAPQQGWQQEEEPEGELTVDMYETPTHIIVQAMIAGVKPDDLDISITRDSLTLKGKRAAAQEISAENYHARELYWGAFSRTLRLPEEIEVDEAEAIEKYGLLTVRLPKINKGRQAKLRVKSGGNN